MNAASDLAQRYLHVPLGSPIRIAPFGKFTAAVSAPGRSVSLSAVRLNFDAAPRAGGAAARALFMRNTNILSIRIGPRELIAEGSLPSPILLDAIAGVTFDADTRVEPNERVQIVFESLSNHQLELAHDDLEFVFLLGG